MSARGATTSWLVQALCLAFAFFVLTADVGYYLSETVLASRVGDLGADFNDSGGSRGYVQVVRVKPGGAMAAAGVAAGDRVAFDRASDYVRPLAAGESVSFTLDHSGRAAHRRIVVPAGMADASSGRSGIHLAYEASYLAGALFGAFIIWRSRRQTTALLLGTALLAFGIASIDPPFWISELIGYEFGQAAFGIAIYWAVPVLFYAFALRFFEESTAPAERWEKWAFWTYAAILLTLTALRSFTRANAVAIPILGNLLLAEIAVTDLGLAFCLVYLLRGRRSSRANTQRRRTFLLIGASAFVMAQVMDNFLELSAGAPYLVIATLANVVAPALLAYGILRHRVLDVGFAINRTLVYTVVSGVLLAAFGLIEWAVDHFVPIEGREKNALVDAAIAVGVFLTFHRVRDVVERVVERLFFHRWQVAEAALRRFVREAAFVSQPAALARAFVKALSDYAEGAEVALYLADAEGYGRADGEVADTPARIDRDLPALVSLRADPRVVEVHGDGLNAALVAPMINRNQVIGFLLVGPKPSAQDFRPDEIDLVGWATRQVGLDLYALRVEQLEATAAEQRGEIARFETRVDELRLALEGRPLFTWLSGDGPN